jgi:hypothetical protein
MTGRSHESVTRIGWLPAKFEARLGAVAILRCMSPFVAHLRPRTSTLFQAGIGGTADISASAYLPLVI